MALLYEASRRLHHTDQLDFTSVFGWWRHDGPKTPKRRLAPPKYETEKNSADGDPTNPRRGEGGTHKERQKQKITPLFHIGMEGVCGSPWGGGFWRLLEAPGRLLEAPGDSWRLLGASVWRLLEASEGFWRLLKASGGFWRLLRGFWRLLEAGGGGKIHRNKFLAKQEFGE